MKRCIILFVSLLLILLCSCGEAEKPQPSPLPTPTPEPEFVPGSIDGSSYTNDFLSLSFEAPEGWVFASDEEFSLLLGSGTEQLQSDIQLFAPDISSTYYEFYAYGIDGESIIMTVEALSAHDGGKLLSVKDYIDTLSSRYSELNTVKYNVGKSYEHSIAGHSCYVLPLGIEEDGVFQRNCAFRSGAYMVTITISAHSEEELSALEAFITAK